MVAFAATIGACATSRETKPLPRAPDPIVETRTVIERVCPPELLGAIATKPVQPKGAVIEAEPETLGWIGALARWGEGLRARLIDAARTCP